MFEVIQQSEPTASRRRLFFRLIDSADNLSGKVITTTGVKVALSKNGSSAGNSSADIVAVDTVLQPGEYYIELSTAECNTVGHIVGYLKPAGCLATRVQSSVVVYDPYADGATPTQIADALLDRTDAIETGLTPRYAWRLIAAVLFGRASGLDTGTATFRAAVSDSKVRITGTDDENGNRLTVTTDPS